MAKDDKVEEGLEVEAGDPPTLGDDLLATTGDLLEALQNEPKHQRLEQSYRAALEAHRRIIGRPSRFTGSHTPSGVDIVDPAISPAPMSTPTEEWVASVEMLKAAAGDTTPEPVIGTTRRKKAAPVS